MIYFKLLMTALRQIVLFNLKPSLIFAHVYVEKLLSSSFVRFSALLFFAVNF